MSWWEEDEEVGDLSLPAGGPAAGGIRSDFIAPRSAAPDKIARRQEYKTALDQIRKDREHVATFAPTIQSLDTFNATNAHQKTGSLAYQIPGLRIALANLDPSASQLASIASEMQVSGVPQGQGAVSNFERSLYAQGKPDLNKPGGVNYNVSNHMRATYAQETDRLAFLEEFLSTNGTLAGASEAWSKYVAANPYVIAQPVKKKGIPMLGNEHGFPDSGRVELNARRVPWRQYFGLEAAPTAAPAAPAGGGRGAPAGGDRPPEWLAQKAREIYARDRASFVAAFRRRAGHDRGAEQAFASWWAENGQGRLRDAVRQPAAGGRSGGKSQTVKTRAGTAATVEWVD